MGEDQGSGFEWRRKRGRFNRAYEKLGDLPENLLTPRRALLTDAAKRKLYETGIAGQATVLEAPSERTVSALHGRNLGSFRVRVEAPGIEPFETKVWQSFAKSEWERLQARALVACRIDPSDHTRVLLLAPERDEQTLKVETAAELLATGTPAVARVLESRDFGVAAPGSGDPMYELRLEVRSDSEPAPWAVHYVQRVPPGAVGLVAVGSELRVAYRAVGDDGAVAVDWPATTGGRFS
jgi:hypothetical protein